MFCIKRGRQLTDLSIRLARSEAREAEAKAFLEQLRRPLERALEALKDEKNVKGRARACDGELQVEQDTPS